MPTTRQLSIYFPDALRTALKERATELDVTPAAVVRDAVAAWLGSEIDGSRRTSSAVPLADPDVTPTAPPVSAVITQRQGERCYHLHADGVTRWHLDTMPCPKEGNWAAALEAADLETLPPEAIPQD